MLRVGKRAAQPDPLNPPAVRFEFDYETKVKRAWIYGVECPLADLPSNPVFIEVRRQYQKSQARMKKRLGPATPSRPRGQYGPEFY
jgi:hypothetical protein